MLQLQTMNVTVTGKGAHLTPLH